MGALTYQAGEMGIDLKAEPRVPPPGKEAIAVEAARSMRRFTAQARTASAIPARSDSACSLLDGFRV